MKVTSPDYTQLNKIATCSIGHLRDTNHEGQNNSIYADYDRLTKYARSH